jgi:selenocysteine-specific elongation factor
MHVVGTAGHVDHGKSALVRALTGIDPDRFAEEKRRGLTIDLGFAWCNLPSGAQVGIVDVPGHERFIRNMLAGAGAIQAVILVVAADEGWMPQSAEHLRILDFLDIRTGVVAITKADAAPDMVDLVAEEARDRLRGTSLGSARTVAVSAVTGRGLDELLAELDEALSRSRSAPREDGRTRLFVDRSFTIAGAGTVVTGTLRDGTVRAGQAVTLLPGGRTARIRSLQTHGEDVVVADSPRRLAVNLVGLDRRLVRRGDVLVDDDWILSDRFAARLRAARDLGRTLDERGAYELFVGSAQTRCRLKFLEPGPAPLAEVFTDHALPLVPGDRFVIRDVGRWETVAGGVVLDQAPPKLRRGDEAELTRLRGREGLSSARLADQILAERGIIRRDELDHLVGCRIDGTEWRIDAAHARHLEDRAVAIVTSHHASHRLDTGIRRETLRSELGLAADAFDHVVGGWDEIVCEGDVVRLRERGVTISGAEREKADAALEKLRAGGVSPPALGDVGVDPGLAKALERSGELVLTALDIGYPAQTWREIERRVVELAAQGPVTVSEVRDALGTSRKYALPILQKLDGDGVTRRTGDLRELGPRGRDLASS